MSLITDPVAPLRYMQSEKGALWATRPRVLYASCCMLGSLRMVTWIMCTFFFLGTLSCLPQLNQQSFTTLTTCCNLNRDCFTTFTLLGINVEVPCILSNGQQGVTPKQEVRLYRSLKRFPYFSLGLKFLWFISISHSFIYPLIMRNWEKTLEEQQRRDPRQFPGN